MINNQEEIIDVTPEEFDLLTSDKDYSNENSPFQKDNQIIDVTPEEFDLLANESNNQEIPNNSELSTLERGAQYGRGLANVPATAIDLTNQYIAAPALHAGGAALELAGKGASMISQPLGESLNQASEEVYKARDFYHHSNVSGQTAQGINEAIGKDITPRDTIGKVLNMAGEFSFPLSNIAKGAKTGSEILKAGAKHIGSAFGGATGVELGKNVKYFEDDTIGGHIEDFLHAVVGMTIADKGMSAAKKTIVNDIGKDLVEYIKDEGIVNAIKQGATNLIAKPYSKLSKSSSENKLINKLAKEEGIDLPFQVKLGGRFNSFLANTGLKSLFTKRAYDAVTEKADTDMIKAVKSKINQIHPEEMTGEIASTRAQEFLKEESKSIKEKTRSLYEESNSKATEKDKVKPTNSYEVMNDIIPEISAASPSEDMKFVARKLKEIGEAWGFLPDLSKYKDTTEDSVNLIKAIKKNWGENIKEIPVHEIDLQIKALKKDLKHEKDIPGVKNFLNGFIGGMEKDLATSSNKEFIQSREVANQYFKQNVVDRIRTDMASSLMNGEIPKEAYKYMGNAKEIRFLQKVLGKSEAAEEVLSSLKRAKLEDILQQNILLKDGSISYGNLSNMFLHEPEKQALLKELLGEQYTGVKRLAEISKGFVESGKLFGNPSKTSFAMRDFQGTKDLFLAAVRALSGYAITGNPTAAIGEPTLVYATSWLLSSKRFVNTTLKYAEARSAKDKIVLKNRIEKIVKEMSNTIEKRPSSLFSLDESLDPSNENK